MGHAMRDGLRTKGGSGRKKKKIPFLTQEDARRKRNLLGERGGAATIKTQTRRLLRFAEDGRGSLPEKDILPGTTQIENYGKRNGKKT